MGFYITVCVPECLSILPEFKVNIFYYLPCLISHVYAKSLLEIIFGDIFLFVLTDFQKLRSIFWDKISAKY